MPKHVACRFNASPELGGGHAIRCLTLLNKLFETSKALKEDYVLYTNADALPIIAKFNHHDFTAIIIHHNQDLEDHLRDRTQTFDLFVIDHYSLDENFEVECKKWSKTVLVIDDLANRRHCCDVLIDPTLGRNEKDYSHLLSNKPITLFGPQWAIIREDFARHRPYALSRRSKFRAIEHVLISAGLTDPCNATQLYLDSLLKLSFQGCCHIVLGRQAPYLSQIKRKVNTYPFKVNLYIDHSAMAEMLSNTDIVLGAAGSSSWERCVLGLPSAVIILADNQINICEGLSNHGACINLGHITQATSESIAKKLTSLFSSRSEYLEMSQKASSICTGEAIKELPLLIGNLNT